MLQSGSIAGSGGLVEFADETIAKWRAGEVDEAVGGSVFEADWGAGDGGCYLVAPDRMLTHGGSVTWSLWRFSAELDNAPGLS